MHVQLGSKCPIKTLIAETKPEFFLRAQRLKLRVLSYKYWLNFLKGMLQSKFCVDVNAHSDRKWKMIKSLFKKALFSKSFSFFYLFYVNQ